MNVAQPANRYQARLRILRALAVAAWAVPLLWTLYVTIRAPLPRFSTGEPYLERASELSMLVAVLAFAVSCIAALFGAHLSLDAKMLSRSRRRVLIPTALGAVPGIVVAIGFWALVYLAFQS
jgi:hypothetical protein